MLLNYWDAINFLRLGELEGENFSSILALVDLCENHGLPHSVLPIKTEEPYQKLVFIEGELLEWVSQQNGFQGPRITEYAKWGEAGAKYPLSVRARKVLYRIEKVFVAELTEDLLRGCRNCGIVTAKEILEWRDELLADYHGPPSSPSSSNSSV